MRLWCPMLWCMWSQCVVAAECPAQLRMAYNASWRPYIEVTDEVVRGSDIDLIRQLLSKVSSRLQLQFVPEKAAQLMPHGKLVTIPNAGSLPTLEQPEAVTAALEEFLNGPMMLR